MIHRKSYHELLELADIFPVICITGARQVGKTTLAKEYLQDKHQESVYLDMEIPSDKAKLVDAELYFTENSHKCIIIDEVQNHTEIFPIIRGLVDRDRDRLRFILLGSISSSLIKTTESLAGRIAYLEINPISVLEDPNTEINSFQFRGGFPKPLLAKNDRGSKLWLENFIQTFIEKDFKLYGVDTSSIKIRKLWEMLAWQTGGITNYQDLGRSLDLTNKTISDYIDAMEGLFMIMRLQPFFPSVTKRLVKSPKIYVKDTGVMHRLMRMEDFDQLTGTSQMGNSWEGFVIAQIYTCKSPEISIYYYRTHAGAEVDVVLVKGITVIATVEIKYSSSPNLTKGHLISIEDLKSESNFIVIPKEEDYQAAKGIRVAGLRTFLSKYLPLIQ